MPWLRGWPAGRLGCGVAEGRVATTGVVGDSPADGATAAPRSADGRSDAPGPGGRPPAPRLGTRGLHGWAGERRTAAEGAVGRIYGYPVGGATARPVRPTENPEAPGPAGGRPRSPDRTTDERRRLKRCPTQGRPLPARQNNSDPPPVGGKPGGAPARRRRVADARPAARRSAGRLRLPATGGRRTGRTGGQRILGRTEPAGGCATRRGAKRSAASRPGGLTAGPLASLLPRCPRCSGAAPGRSRP
ncbi:hypothetical protein M2162_003068 [Streptomyces sp. SAI-041]|nr:hypothetical protein [Streptomyces sp. SAI-041]